MSNLGDKIRKARETQVEVNGHKYTVRRPTEAQRTEWFRDEGISPLELVRRCVISWDLLETDLLAGGNPIPAEFSSDAFAEYVNDNIELWIPLSEAIKEAIKSRLGSLDDAKKN